MVRHKIVQAIVNAYDRADKEREKCEAQHRREQGDQFDYGREYRSRGGRDYENQRDSRDRQGE